MRLMFLTKLKNRPDLMIRTQLKIRTKLKIRPKKNSVKTGPEFESERVGQMFEPFRRQWMCRLSGEESPALKQQSLKR